MTTPLRIVKLHIDNFKGIKAVDITPSGAVTRVTGKNSAGKSSVLDAIQAALGGKDAMPAEPLRHGATKGNVVLKMSNGWEIHRKVTEKGAYLEVIGEGGEAFASPQSMLDKLTDSGMLFDPLAFSRMKPQDQAATLLKLAGVDLAANRKAREQAYNERTVINRQAKEAEAVLAEKRKAIGGDISAADAKEAADLLKQINEARADLAEAERAVRDAKNTLASKTEMLSTITSNFEEQSADIDQQIEALKAKKAALAERYKTAQVEITNAVLTAQAALNDAQSGYAATKEAHDELATGIDTDDLRKTVEAASRGAEVRASLKAHTDAAEKLAAESKALTAKIEKLDAERVKQLSSAKMPVADLSVDDEGVVRFAGTPLDQAAMNEKMRVGMAVGMAMQKPGGLRVMLVRDGSLLDGELLAELTRMAETRDWQMWVEETTDGERIAGAIVIEEGEVKA